MTGYIQWALDAISYQLTQSGGLLSQLPSSPILVPAGTLSGISSVMGGASYFLPIHEAATFIGGLVPIVLLWYVIRLALRWLKVAADG